MTMSRNTALTLLLLFGPQQLVVSCPQGIADRAQLRGLKMLDAAFNFNQCFTGHLDACQLHHPHKLGLSDTFLLAYRADIRSDKDLRILFYFLR